MYFYRLTGSVFFNFAYVVTLPTRRSCCLIAENVSRESATFVQTDETKPNQKIRIFSRTLNY
jgi:hypothetical protein